MFLFLYRRSCFVDYYHKENTNELIYIIATYIIFDSNFKSVMDEEREMEEKNLGLRDGTMG